MTERDTGRRVGLDRRKIGEAALDLVDEQGIEALTMRTLAARLDVTPMALYNHVDGRDEVEQLLVDAVFADTRTTTAGGDDPPELKQIAHRLRSMYLAHPNAIPLVQTVLPTDTASLALVEAALRAASGSASGTPVDIRRARDVWVGLVSLVNGYVAYQAQRHFTDVTVARRLPERFAFLRHAVEVGPIDHEATFAMIVDAYLTGVADRR